MVRFVYVLTIIDLLHKSYKAPVPYLNMHQFEIEMCTCVHIHLLQNGGFGDIYAMHCRIFEMGLSYDDVNKWKYFRVTGLLYGEFTGHRWIPRTRPVTRSFDVLNAWVNNRGAGDAIALIMTSL